MGQNNAGFELGDPTTYRKLDSYDPILNTDALEHILEDEKVQGISLASLRKDGYLVADDPVVKRREREYAEGDVSVIGEHVREGYQARVHRQGYPRPISSRAIRLHPAVRLWGPLREDSPAHSDADALDFENLLHHRCAVDRHTLSTRSICDVDGHEREQQEGRRLDFVGA
ncbi:MAG: hypothetical protein IPP40_14890 [bacterium]|nr:hypothetical protein [bacterium]